ncbi:DNA topoisomerase IB [Leifsonia aquatica]|uniref:DNA topoisomerase n=1 Tax=Leifsonia aquatica TaxID=144185 RepID=A0A7W4UVJ7_LEIAQ|nr:DNA topoisomerase IB [Leifsonia aquatica]MBB2966827.1 DNA topoisomerase-1 [Leifsonia aquatica]
MTRLRRSDPSGPGYHRRASNKGPVYEDVAGNPIVDERELERIRSLVIPPAWEDVWISPDARGHIQAVGTDQAGRRQYRYHDSWRLHQDRVKFERAAQLAETLPSARRKVTMDLRAEGFGRDRVLAAAFRIIDLGSVRIGSEEYLHANGSRGLTTLLCRHARIDGDEITLTFPAKSAQKWTSTIVDADLAELLTQIQALRGQRSRLLSWKDGTWHTLRPASLNEYIRRQTGGEFTAKDFRTLHGTIVAAEALAELGISDTESRRKKRVTAAVNEAAAALGNTPAIARNSYIDPRVFDRYRQGEVIDTAGGRVPEPALLELLSS